jgi:hypothetical protein
MSGKVYFRKIPLDAASIELRQRAQARMRETGEYVLAKAEKEILASDPALAERIDQLRKGPTPR